MLASFIALSLLYNAQLAHCITLDRRNIGTPLALYTDEACSTPSTSNPNVSLGLNICAVTTGLESFVITPTPCTSGTVAVWEFTDTGCESPGNAFDWYRGANDNNNCYATYKGAMAAIMLTCDADHDETTPSRPTATTTIAVGPVANAATPATADSTGQATGGSTPSTTASSSGSTGTSGSGASGGSTASSKSTSGWNSLDEGTRIGIIVALTVGVPPILIGLYTIQLMRKKKQRRMGQAHG